MHETAPPWTGSLLLRPGTPCPGNLTSTRPDLVARLAHGRLASELPGLLATLFNLCGNAHRLCARSAVQAALQDAAASDADADADSHAHAHAHAYANAEQAELLRVDTLREHLRRMGLDWPRQLVAAADQPAMGAAALEALRSGPVPIAAAPGAWTSQRDAIAAWLARDWLGMPAETWLRAWDQGPRDWLGQWSAHTDGWLPRLLHGARTTADLATPTSPALRVHGQPVTLQALAAALHRPGFSRQPQWQGACAETGPWTRLHQRDAWRLETPWLRLGARLADAARLALPDAPARTGSGWLQFGHLALPGRSGLAWVEMARGLLVHCVTLDGQGPQARVQRCDVVAPTDWNFHPQGAVAQALARLRRPVGTALVALAQGPQDGQDTHGTQGTRRILALMAAYDPCVPFMVYGEPAHA